MSNSKHTLAEAILTRMSLGAVPMDGVYWFDPKAARKQAESALASAGAESPVGGNERMKVSSESGQGGGKTPRGIGAIWSFLRRMGEAS
jgi:hypothetical protein